jgi:CRP-like cAMP-binding protein
MTEHILAQQMRSAAIFERLSPFQLTEIARHADRRLFREGDTLAVCGEGSDGALLIVGGSFQCTEGVGSGRRFDSSVSGTMIGEMAMFIDDFEHPSTFVASSRVKAMLITRAAMLGQMAQDPDMAARLVDTVAERLHQMTDEMRRIEAIFSDDATPAVKQESDAVVAA